MSEFNDWFCSLPEGHQAVLRDDKWRLADSAFQAGFKQAQAEIDALKAQNAELLAAQQWRDIESAPSDEVLFLHNEVMGLSGVGYFNGYLDCWSWSYSSEPTHWQLLPPPAIAKARGDL